MKEDKIKAYKSLKCREQSPVRISKTSIGLKPMVSVEILIGNFCGVLQDGHTAVNRAWINQKSIRWAGEVHLMPKNFMDN